MKNAMIPPFVDEIIKREVERYFLQKCKVGILRENPNTADAVLGCFGVTDKGEPAVQFYLKRIRIKWFNDKKEIMEKYSSRENWIHHMVLHEFRHYQQWLYFKKYNLDWNEYNQLSKSIEYEHRLIELDAQIYSHIGEDKPLAALARNYCRLKLKQLEDLKSNAIDINTFRSYCYESNRFNNLADKFSKLMEEENKVLHNYDLDYSKPKIILASTKPKGEIIWKCNFMNQP